MATFALKIKHRLGAKLLSYGLSLLPANTATARILVATARAMLFNSQELTLITQSVAEVAANPRIPAFEPYRKQGREYRRDEAAWQTYRQSGMRQCRANLGCELTYWLSKQDVEEKPRKHEPKL